MLSAEDGQFAICQPYHEGHPKNQIKGVSWFPSSAFGSNPADRCSALIDRFMRPADHGSLHQDPALEIWPFMAGRKGRARQRSINVANKMKIG
jgi:hypothetical protein